MFSARRARRGAGLKGRDSAFVSAGYVSGGLRLVASCVSGGLLRVWWPPACV